jgi:hypothetical protein
MMFWSSVRHSRRHSSGPTQRVFLAVRRQGIRGVSPVNEEVEGHVDQLAAYKRYVIL